MSSTNSDMPKAMPEELASAMIETVNAGARLINLSASLARPSPAGEHELEEALNYAAKHNVIVVAAAGNQGTVSGSTITCHPWVIPVVGCDLLGRPTAQSNLGISIGRRGLSAPGESIASLGSSGKSEVFSGTSAAAPFVTGAIALLWSEFPSVSSTDIKLAIAAHSHRRRKSVAPPLLDAWAAYQAMVG